VLRELRESPAGPRARPAAPVHPAPPGDLRGGLRLPLLLLCASYQLRQVLLPAQQARHTTSENSTLCMCITQNGTTLLSVCYGRQ